MAEWTGRKKRQHSPVDPDAAHDHMADNEPPLASEAPGAVSSPQLPGEVPDRSTVPGHHSTRVPRATNVQRPLTEYGTAQALMNVFAAPPGKEMEPSRFEQATAAYEEMRKAYPAELPPSRPAPGYALERGDATASEMQAIEAGPAPSAPMTASGEAYNARPAGGTGEVAPPARTDAPAAEVGSAFSPSDAPSSVRSPSDAIEQGGGKVGQSRWAEAAPRPGDLSGPAGTLPAAKDGEPADQEGTGTPPPVAPQ